MYTCVVRWALQLKNSRQTRETSLFPPFFLSQIFPLLFHFLTTNLLFFFLPPILGLGHCSSFLLFLFERKLPRLHIMAWDRGLLQTQVCSVVRTNSSLPDLASASVWLLFFFSRASSPEGERILDRASPIKTCS